MDFSFTEQPHTRLNILTGEKVLVSPHRSKRPWQGQVEDSFVFINDFSALLSDTSPEQYNQEGLLQASTERGICKVIAFTPRHDLTLPEMRIEEIKAVVDLWQSEFVYLQQQEWIKY